MRFSITADELNGVAGARRWNDADVGHLSEVENGNA